MNRLVPLFMLILAALLYLCWLVLTPAQAQTGHPKPGQPHWYEVSCCSNRDCEPIPFDAIMEIEGGYLIDYVSAAHGAVREFFPAKEARHSQDGQFHICFRYTPLANGTRLRCLYRPVNS